MSQSAARILLMTLFFFSLSLPAQESSNPYCDDLENLDISYFKSYGALYGEQGNAVIQLDNGNVATGMQLSNPLTGGAVYPGLLLTDPAGEKIFCKKYTDFGSPNAIQHMLVNDQGFLLTGVSWVMQTDSLGEVLWCKSMSIGTSFAITDIIAIDNAYVITGFSRPSTTGYSEIVCLQINGEGEVAWSTQIESNNFNLNNLRILPYQNGYMLAGTGKKGIFTGALMMRLDSLASPIWSKYYDTFYDDEFMELLVDDTDHFYLIGRNYSIDTEWDPFLFKVDSAGNLVESIHLDGNGEDESPRCATMFADGQLAISFDHGNGNSRSPAVASMSLEDFSIDWCKSYEYEPQFTNYVIDIVPALNDGLLMVGDMHVIGKTRDTYLIHTMPNGDAGCYTSDYSIAHLTKDVEVTDHPDFAAPVLVETSDMVIEAIEDFAVVEFEACENVPPCAQFNPVLMSLTECEEACYTFYESSSFFPSTWEWTFENGNPSSFSGQNPPDVCWTEEGAHEVQLTVNSDDGEHSSSEIVVIDFDCPPIIPNVFTPNDDGKNDEFIIQHLPPDFHLTIFNRWGQSLFETEDPQKNWNGTNSRSGKEASEGVYFYELQDHADDISYTGHLQLLR